MAESIKNGDVVDQPKKATGGPAAISYKPANDMGVISLEVPAVEIPTHPAPAKKKKKSKKSKSKTARFGTGFEPSYADAPITPEEFKYEKYELYNPRFDFAVRIEACIQRFRSKRRMNSQQADIFTKFMKYGGISSGSRQFTGGMNYDNDDLDAEAIRQMNAVDFVDDDKYQLSTNKDAIWTVDFTGVMKGFLSDFIRDKFNVHAVGITTITGILRNFLRYVRYHNVCPEYEDDIRAAMAICDVADAEIPLLPGISNRMNADLFNKACSAYFSFANNETCPWVETMPRDEAEEFLRTILPPEMDIKTIARSESKTVYLQIRSTELPENETLGRLHTFDLGDCPLEPPQDRTVAEAREYAAYMALGENERDKYSFLMGQEALQDVRVGMKIFAKIGRLTNGTCYLEEIVDLHTSYWTSLWNAAYLDWKQPVAWDKGHEDEGGEGEGREDADSERFDDSD